MTPAEIEEFDMLSWRLIADLPVTVVEYNRFVHLQRLKAQTCPE